MMNMTIMIRVTIDGVESVEQVAEIQRDELQPGNLGLNIAETKSLLGSIQTTMVTAQASNWMEQHRRCSKCDAELRCNGHHAIVLRTVFGKMNIKSQRLYRCPCEGATRASFSPLAELLAERSTPELEYLETKWASLMSYGMTLNLLKDVLPISEDLSTTAIRKTAERVAQRLDGELDKEQYAFIDGTPNDWQALPDSPESFVVGIDGGYVHARSGTRKDGWFEVIVGKSIPTAGDTKCFGFISRLDPKPKRRLHDMLVSQGIQMNQRITFLSDGGDTVRDLQMCMSPNAEHILDWFHITMRLTVMHQLAVGLINATQAGNACDNDKKIAADIVQDIDSLKWNLWHGNVRQALSAIVHLGISVDSLEIQYENKAKLSRMLDEFSSYIEANRLFIPNYGDRWRNGETISTAFVESTVDQVISRRFVKKQQMRWTERGCNNVLQLRTRVINEELRPIMERWYPGMKAVA
jgi:hypothetical protein